MIKLPLVSHARPGLRFWFLALAVFLAIETLDRLAIAGWTIHSEGRASAQLVFSFLYGVADDAATALILGAPFLLGLHALAPLWRRRWARIGAHGLLYALLSALAFTEIAELFFWNEFDSRFNSMMRWSACSMKRSSWPARCSSCFAMRSAAAMSC